MTKLFYYHGNNLFQPVNGGANVTITTSSPPPSNAWQTAVDSRNFANVDNWYVANTGHEALGYSLAELVDVGGPIVSTHDGEIIEKKKGTYVRIGHSNVTVRGCRITGPGLYGMYYNPTFGSHYTTTTVEYCTIASTANEETNASLLLSGEGDTTRNLIFRNNNCYGYVQGSRSQGNVLAEYNWYHDFAHPIGAHANSYRHVGMGPCIARRNYCTDGSSGCMSIYFDKEPTGNITYSENILNGSSPLASPSYLINFKDGTYAAGAVGIKIINNYFGDKYQYGEFAGAAGFVWNSQSNEFKGNKYFLTGQPYADM